MARHLLPALQDPLRDPTPRILPVFALHQLIPVDLEPPQVLPEPVRVVAALLPRARRDEELKEAQGPGNVLTIAIESEHVTEVFTGFGEKGVSAEAVANKAAAEALAYLEAGVPVSEHLADQLLLPMALAGGGSFRTVALSSHTTTQLALLEQLLGVRTSAEQISEKAWQVEIGR